MRLVTTKLAITVFISSMLFMFSNNAFALTYKAQKLQSKEGRVSLIELFTSEGCNSCPPAEHFINDLKTKTNLWEDFVPVAFHVDYWDYLGWKDIYAKSEHTHRQRIYAAENREPTVYTPGMRAEGREWRNWRRADLQDFDSIKRKDIGVLELDILEDGTFKARFELSEQDSLTSLGIRGRPYTVTVALLGMGISTDVKRGENAGRTLDHDFMVLESAEYEIHNGIWQGKLPTTKVTAPRYAIAVWVSSNKSQSPIQAVGGYLN